LSTWPYDRLGATAVFCPPDKRGFSARKLNPPGSVGYEKERNMDTSVKPLRSAEQLLELAKRPSEATLNLQSDLLDAYAQLGRAWIARAHKEMELWSQLASNLAASRSVPEALELYQACVSQRLQMAMDDGVRFVEDWQGLTAKLTRSLSMGTSGKSNSGSAKRSPR
jgi:hypothetical protein